MTSNQVKQAIRQMQNYNIDELNTLSIKSGISLMIIGFWYQAIHS